MRMKWLHLSDIHFNFKNYDSHEMRNDFLERINLLSQNEPFTHLFLTGDILYKNTVADQETVEFVNKLIKSLQLTTENVYIVPGNHDHDRDVVIEKMASLHSQDDVTIDNLDQTFQSSLYDAFSKFYIVYHDIFGADYYAKQENPHSINNSKFLTVIKLNTAWLDTDSAKDHFLHIGSRQLQLLLSKNKEKLKETVNIAMGHHPLRALSISEQSRILNLFQKHNIGIYFCGHSHKPNINVYREHDVVEIVAPGGFVDNEHFSTGGYVWGVIDTDMQFYKAEIYNWNDGKWCIESTLKETDDHGIFYFNTAKFSNNTDVVAVDCKIMGKHIPKDQLKQSLGVENFDIHTYCGLPGNPSAYTEEAIRELSDTVLLLSEKGKNVHIYPLAPIPMLLLFGFSLQKDTKLYVHQYDRNMDKWVYSETEEGVSLEHQYRRYGGNILAVSISMSFLVSSAMVSEALTGKKYDTLEFVSSRIKPGFPLYISDVATAVREIIEVLNPLVNDYSELHIFAAIPAGVAVELGRNLLKTVYRNVYTYQFEDGHYVQDVIINKTLIKVHETSVPFFSFDVSKIAYVPILGRVPCGPLKEAVEECENCFPIPESVLPNGDYYILRATGDSMINVGIEDGDEILIRQQNVANEGDIVVAYIEGETTIKRIHYDNTNQLIILKPENDQYKSQAYKEIDIQGIAIKVMKDL